MVGVMPAAAHLIPSVRGAGCYATFFLRTRQLYPLQLILREILIHSNVENMMSNVASRGRVPIGALKG